MTCPPLVRIALLVLLSAALISAAGCADRISQPRSSEDANTRSCESNRREIAAAVEAYGLDWGVYPQRPLAHIAEYLKPIPTCPSSGSYSVSQGGVTLLDDDFVVYCSAHHDRRAPLGVRFVSASTGLPRELAMQGIGLDATRDEVLSRLGKPDDVLPSPQMAAHATLATALWYRKPHLRVVLDSKGKVGALRSGRLDGPVGPLVSQAALVSAVTDRLGQPFWDVTAGDRVVGCIYETRAHHIIMRFNHDGRSVATITLMRQDFDLASLAPTPFPSR